MKDKTNYITQEQFQALLDNIGSLSLDKMTHGQLQLAFQVLYEAALRISELINITPADLDLEHKQIILRNTKGGKRRCKCMKIIVKEFKKPILNKGKFSTQHSFYEPDAHCKKCNGTGRYRIKEYAWVTPQTWDKLLEFSSTLQQNEKLFPISRQSFWQYCKTLGESIGVKIQHEEKETTNLFPHALRHSRPIHLLQTGQFEINEIMTKLRHKSLQPTTTYVTVSRESVQAKEANL